MSKRLVLVLFDCCFVLVIDFDYSYSGVLLICFFCCKSCCSSYDPKSCFCQTFFVYLFAVMSLLV